ncbi:endo-1,4-beta-xylanase [Arenibacter sp. F26102]|uniref:endo-1,4-beta-xylanase n=1 Tax=Arenibacter sp. F26102 TaxID=2926416 RepID=UPI001FF37FBF|nr:endo-1,4-beta-xylanase [Arenibacter sp. F26102]MCK0146020.1 endo-1,4-beta-xylanase [Arenibacter sp. F26102]
MNQKIIYILLLQCLFQTPQYANGIETEKTRGTISQKDTVMSAAYWKLWNSKVQAKIDRDIEENRKADAVLNLKGLPAGTAITVKQVSHDFIFGAHIFNFNQLGSNDLNTKYKELYGTLFNSATIPFYWKKFEMQPNRPRFREEYWDTEEYWNQVKEPQKEPHWRRPATDPIVEFCENKGIRLHGHTMTWGNREWHNPEWLFDDFCPQEEKEKLNKFSQDELYKLSPAEIENLAPVFSKELTRLFERRVVELANYYGDRIHSWDVVNESATDFGSGQMVPGDKICKSHYGLMPGDYTFESFKIANRVFPENTLLNINDYKNDADYLNQIKDLRSRGSRVDITGSQMHLFNPQSSLDIAEGKAIETPEIVWDKMAILSKAGLPIHLSEITITSPGDDKRGQEIQAIIARNLYRLWFSVKPMMGITWWNVVDGCGAPGEPSVSGLFSRDMKPKPSFYALNNLINHEWKTNTTVKVGKDGIAKFRGFKGRYSISWENSAGEQQNIEFYLKEDGDGL